MAVQETFDLLEWAGVTVDNLIVRKLIGKE
jgi:hypothetical protein